MSDMTKLVRAVSGLLSVLWAASTSAAGPPPLPDRLAAANGWIVYGELERAKRLIEEDPELAEHPSANLSRAIIAMARRDYQEATDLIDDLPDDPATDVLTELNELARRRPLSLELLMTAWNRAGRPNLRKSTLLLPSVAFPSRSLRPSQDAPLGDRFIL